MLKASEFTKNNNCRTSFDKNLQKIFRTNILGPGTEQVLLVVVLMIDLWLKLRMEIDSFSIIIEGTLIQIWKCPYMFVFIEEQCSEILAYLILTILELFASEVCKFFKK